MVRKFSAKARRYMLIYLHQRMKSQQNDVIFERNYDMNERLLKQYKSHRDAASFDGKFITQVWTESIGATSVNN